jgi:hypothetical protein
MMTVRQILEEAFTRVLVEHSIQLNDIDVKWMNTQTVGGPSFPVLQDVGFQGKAIKRP